LQDPRLLIMDEPTSVLTPQAVEKLFETLRRLASEGCSILYISHKLDEIRALCHKATVLRAGRVTGTCDPRRESSSSLARMMIGGDLPHPAHRDTAAGDAALVVRDSRCPPTTRSECRWPTSISPCATARYWASRASRVTARRN
jgi:simple sugar transport system ATP-binding protein